MENPISASIDDDGSLVLRHVNGDRVRFRMSHFHGLLVTAGRAYMGPEGYKEVTAYAGDLGVIKDWFDRYPPPYCQSTPTGAWEDHCLLKQGHKGQHANNDRTWG